MAEVDGAKAYEDPDTKVINYTEEYRKAKRNVLVWAVATLAVTFGLPISDKAGGRLELELPGLVRNLSYSHELLVAGALTILATMFLGYLRAETNLIVRNSYFARKNDTTSAIEAIESMRTQLVEIDRSLLDREEAVQRAKIMTDSQLSDAANRFNRIQYFLSQSEGEPIAPTTSKELSPIQFAKTEVGELHGDFERLRGYALAESEELANRRATLNTAFGQFEGLSNQLAGFSQRIGLAERRWFWAYDCGLVYLSSITAMVLAAQRLIWPEHFLRALKIGLPW